MLHKIRSNQFFKVFSFNSYIIIGKVLTSFIISKVTAIYLGPSGFAIVGNFKNIFQAVLGVTSSGFESGVIRHIAENRHNKQSYSTIISSVFTISLFLSLFIASLLFFFSEKLSIYLLKDNSTAFIFKYFALLLPFISFQLLLLYLINGLQKIKLFTYLSLFFNIINAILTFLFIHFFSLKGALLVSLIVPVVSFFSSFIFKEIRSLFQRHFLLFKNISKEIIASMSVYLGMAVYSTVLISISYLFLRIKIIETINIDSAGLWEAMNRISTFYMMLFTSLFTLYLLPKLSQNKSVSGYYVIMRDYFKFLIPIVIITFTLIFLLKIYIIRIFLTEEFLTINKFFLLQLVGDLLKIIGFSIAYQFHAKKMVFYYVITDAVLYGAYYFLSAYLIDLFDLKGVFYAYVSSTFLYLILVLYFVISSRNKYLKVHV
ncbi:MAG: O-antigen translocase [Bacteroidia bacterium]|nr:O-antigen translocase [Bacteroidia bacterium]